MTILSRFSNFLFAMAMVMIMGLVRAQPPSCSSVLTKCRSKLEVGRLCDGYLPVLPSSFGTPIRPELGYNVEEIREGIWAVSEGTYYAMVIYYGKTLIVIDSPEGNFVNRDIEGIPIGSKMSDAIKEIVGKGKPEVVRLVYSHHHFDHIGTSVFTYESLKRYYPNAKVEIWATEYVKMKLSMQTSGRAPLPTRLINKDLLWRLGRGIDLEIFLESGHTGSDLIFYVPPRCTEEGVVFLVDVVFPGWTPFKAFALTKDFAEYQALHYKVLDLDFEYFIGGHLTKIGSRYDVALNLEITNTTTMIGAAALGKIVFADAVAPLMLDDPNGQNAGNFFLGFKTYLDELNRYCASQLILHYGCNVSAIDVFASSLCDVAIEFLRLDT